MSNENSVKLQKFYMEFQDPETNLFLQYQQENIEGEGLEQVILPFDPAKLGRGHVKMRLYHSDAKFPIVVDGFKKVQYIIFGEGDDPDPALKEWKMSADSRLAEILPSYFKSDEDQSFPKMTYSDVTEHDMFGEPPVEDLSTNKGGIWAWHGLRKFKIEVKGLDFEKFKNAADIKHKATLYWYKRDNDEIPSIFENNLRYNLKGNYYTAYINTNELGAAMERAESPSPIFAGRFEIHISQHRYKQIYAFPIRVCVHKTTLDTDVRNSLVDDENFVSIDFGTSSTCAAIQGKSVKELITLSGEGKRDTNDNDNAFENPTNLMLYTWSEFYNQWRKDNISLPFLMTKLKDIEDVREVDYDSGYTVDDVFKEVIGGDDAKGRLKMQAIITQLKMIPYILKNERELSLYPLNDPSRPKIFITDDIEKEDATHLNPIAFYGYLISRAINNPANQKIYISYKISMPVKFEESLRENICKSLEYGIKRGLPRPIAEAVEDGEPLVTVKTEYEESVACIGAVVGKQLKIDETSPEAKLFAIFDLGGGTLDLSYGMFRNSVGDEQMFGSHTIQIFGVGGNENVGGEKLIHKIAYKIYCDNRDVINANDIVFELPMNELEPKGFNEGLFTHDDNSAANLSIIKEKIARKLFIYGSKEDENGRVQDNLTEVLGTDVVPSGRNAKITLRDRHGEEQEVTLKIEDIDDFIENEIRNIITKDFKPELEEVFNNPKNLEAMKQAGINDFSIDKVSIFLGGNASKQHFIKDILGDEVFPNNAIAHIGEGEDEDKNDKYKLTCKSAVAFGQIALTNDLNIITPESESGGTPFRFYVGYTDTGSGEFVKVIDKHGSDNDWKKANVITKDDKTALVYTDSPSFDNLTPKKKKVKVTDIKKRMLYIRIAEGMNNYIEYRLGGLNETFSADEPLDPEKVIELKDPAMR